MVELVTEFLFGLIGFFSLIRIVYQARVSKKEGRSITPIKYWLITILIGVLFFFYGLLSDSIIVPITGIVMVLVSFYNINIELKRIEIE